MLTLESHAPARQQRDPLGALPLAREPNVNPSPAYFFTSHRTFFFRFLNEEYHSIRNENEVLSNFNVSLTVSLETV